MDEFLHRFIPRGGLILTLAAFGSYAVGLLRDRIFAQRFGAGPELDAYNAAFLIPDFLLNFFVAGGLAAAFVPIFSDALRRDPKRAELFARTVMSGAIGVMFFWGVLLFFFAPFIAPLVAPGFDRARLELLAELLRILSLSPILFAVSNYFGAVLNAQRRFVAYGLSPILYNLGIIFGALALSPSLGVSGVAFGTVLGALLHGVIRAWDLWRVRFPLMPSFQFSLPEFRAFLTLMIPKMFGHPIELATFWGFTAIASTLEAGSIVVLNFARNFQSVPVSLIGIAFSTAVFPSLAKEAAAGNSERFFDEFLKTLKQILFFTIPASLFMFVFREEIIGVLLGGGAFTKDAIVKTAAMLGIFTLSIPTESVSHLLARAFYATKNTALPVAVSFLGLIVSIVLGFLLAPVFGILMLPIAFFAGSLLKIAILGLLLPLRLRAIKGEQK